VTRVDAKWGHVLDPDAMREAIARSSPRVVAFVHAETSTGACQPVEPITRAAREAGAVVILDCVTSLAGLPLALDAWGVDAAYAGTQKCLSCPPGLSPATFSSRALARVAERRTPVPSWYFDLGLLGGYFGERRAYHHTAPIAAVVGLLAALRRVEDEGMPARAARHRDAAARLIAGVTPFGFEPLVAAEHRLPMLTSLRLPDGIVRDGEAALRRRLLHRHGIEVGGGLGKLAGRIWRVGLMGENAREEPVDRLLAALEAELV
jgi:alanine-glyoxylate transaminase/serine-glyoxylate transaminase/serine-pyruvate transaminase